MLNLPGKTFDRQATPIDLAPDFLRKLHAERQARLQRMAPPPAAKNTKPLEPQPIAKPCERSTYPYGPYLTNRQRFIIDSRIIKRMREAEAEAAALDQDRAVKVTVRQIIREAAQRFGVTPSDIVSDRRTVAAVIPRQWAMLQANRRTTLSLPAIGRCFNRDHTTVLHGIRKAKQREDAAKADAATRMVLPSFVTPPDWLGACNDP